MKPSTFASAAAGNATPQSNVRDGASEWSRRSNGNTQTFRRQSNSTTLTSASQASEATTPQAHPPRYVPPHRNGMQPDTRYSKSQMLDLFRAQQSIDGGLKDGISSLYINGWQPEAVNGSASAGGWSRGDNARDVQPGPEICWDRDGTVEPLGLVEMNEDERELFANSVNTPLKPPATQQNKENQQANGLQSRKLSVSTASPGAFGLPSPSTTRTGYRRRETSESYPFPNSIATPTSAFERDQRASSPPPSLVRRRTDLKDTVRTENLDPDEQRSSVFGSLKRNPTGPLSASIAAPVSPWATTNQNNAFSPMGSFGNQAAQDKRPNLSGRAESRFKSLLQKDSSEDVGTRSVERKGSISSLHKVDEHETWKIRQDPANETLTEDDEDDEMLSGSAALNANSDLSPPHPRHGLRAFDTPSRGNIKEESGFGAFGMTADHAPGFGQHTPSHMRHSGHEPMSPTDTNPYRSPDQYHENMQRLHEEGDDESDMHSNSHLPGLGGFGADSNQHLGLGGLGAFQALGNQQGAASDRSQTSSAGPARPFPGLGGLGQIGGMPNAAPWQNQSGLGGPGRQGIGMPSPFGQGMFSSSSELQSPSLAGLGGSGLLSAQNAFSAGGSRLGSMFPQGMQDQIHANENDDRVPGAGAGTIGQREAALNDQNFNDFQHNEGTDHHHIPPSALSQQEQGTMPPAPQQRTMVMPDRMRWIYKDPQGQTQGPWSGLEMHDWYRAGFFSPELLVKKAEDPDYEPLAQLIRRIGNSREPFLVPQIGIPHGAPSAQAPWASPVAGVAPGAQPPFASSFPSFGTTLTAEQQNALERRKQEEQYLMARQKEHLAQAQIAQRMQQIQHPGFGAANAQSSLNHHSSAQSLHSQPSFSSMTSPSAYQQSPVQAPSSAHNPAGFDRGQQPGGIGGAETLGHIREEEIPNIMNRLNLGAGRGANQFGAPGQPFAGQQQSAPQHVQQMLQDRAMLQQEQAMHDAAQEEAEHAQENDRLHEFEQLQAEDEHDRTQEPLSLTEQVQKAASAKQSPATAQAPWTRHEGGLPGAFPPAPSQSPLPAPAAQRTSRQSVADQLHAETSRTQSPSTETPSSAVAPWAKEQIAAKGPSLREIQEMEAKKAAEAEGLAAAARRAAVKKELEAQALAAASAAAVQPGLPTGANWAASNIASPATPSNAAASPWSKAGPTKPTLTQTKSMAQIQKEEEARKKKLAASQVQTSVNAMASVANPAGGKSYANLAGKPNAVMTGGAAGAWTTVGASGKTKTPTTPTAPPPTRAVSSSIVPTTSARKAPARSVTGVLPGNVNAQDEFRKWAINELRPDLSKGIPAEDFVNALISLGPDTDIITEAVHGSSNTIDSRHFAEEFIRRKKLADKGLIDSTIPPKSVSPNNAAGNAAGGWNEVAKKGPVKETAKDEGNGNFRVVAPKKKGAKR